MRIAHVLFATAHGPLTYQDLSAGGRGVTGSEQAMLNLAKEQAAQGNHVLCYLPTATPGIDQGVEMLDFDSAWPRLRRLDTADVVISWLSADALRNLNPKQLRIHAIQINDWMINGYEFEKYVDVFVGCSKAHRDHLKSLTRAGAPVDGIWEVIPNGTLFSQVEERTRKPHKCVYMSSPDRGLHWLLAMWPEILFAYPDAELHVFYEVQKWLDHARLLNSEVGHRSQYVMSRMHKFKNMNVQLHGGVPPLLLGQELAGFDVMLYPCDTITFTEGFSVSVLDACATGVVPVITDCDALGELYGDSGAIVVPRGNGVRWTDNYVEAAIRVLGESDRHERRQRLRAFAQGFNWTRVAGLWSEVIDRYWKEKKNG